MSTGDLDQRDVPPCIPFVLRPCERWSSRSFPFLNLKRNMFLGNPTAEATNIANLSAMTLMMMMMQKHQIIHQPINHLPFLGLHLRRRGVSGEGEKGVKPSNHNRRCHSGSKSRMHAPPIRKEIQTSWQTFGKLRNIVKRAKRHLLGSM